MKHNGIDIFLGMRVISKFGRSSIITAIDYPMVTVKDPYESYIADINNAGIISCDEDCGQEIWLPSDVDTDLSCSTCFLYILRQCEGHELCDSFLYTPAPSTFGSYHSVPLYNFFRDKEKFFEWYCSYSDASLKSSRASVPAAYIDYFRYERVTEDQILRVKNIKVLPKQKNVRELMDEFLANRKPRTPHCFSCHTNLNSDVNKKCSACGWLICPTCGSCGCNYTGKYIGY